VQDLNWREVVTAIVAVYGAVLSTISWLAGRREKRRQVTVRLAFGVPLYGHGPGDQQVLIDASNAGHRPVNLVAVGFRLPDKRVIPLIQPSAIPPLPLDLTEGKNCIVMVDPHVLSRTLREAGFPRKVKLVGFFRDAVDQTYTSKKWLFDVAGWSGQS